MADEYDIAVDFMDMTDDRRLWACAVDARPGFAAVVGRYAVVGDDDAELRVARILSVDADGNIELEVLAGAVESHQDLLTSA